MYLDSGALEATITVTIALQTQQSGFCNTMGSTIALTAAVAGAFGPVGAGFAAIFGVISAECS